jgi:hypothetical protein
MLRREHMMGAWSTEPWSNDEAADWFARFFKNCNLSLIDEEFRCVTEVNEKYDAIRAAYFLLQKLALPYVWPVSERAPDPKNLIAKRIEILQFMINPPNTRWSFLDM